MRFTSIKENKLTMKKLLSILAIAVLGISTTFAQTAVSTTVKQTPAQVKVTTKTPVVAKTEVKKVETKVATVKTTVPVVAKKEVKKVAVATNAAGVKLKADGTPDKRYKAAVKVTGPTKKDGTADMRYKVNKEAAKKN
jgi:putative NIF3 family GTP cyclohydrolase 1 type 2